MAERGSATGAVFVVVGDEKATEVRSIVEHAALDVPCGRILFVLWTQSDSWSTGIPVESTAVASVLGDPSRREDSAWDFYGCGAARLYTKKGKRPKSSVLWVGFRRKGEKAYLRNKSAALKKTTIADSTIPVSDKVFTRDVANNVWHVNHRNGMDRVISRLQALTTWSDEIALVHKGRSRRRKKHVTLDLTDDLVPVANKVEYSIENFPFAQTGKRKK